MSLFADDTATRKAAATDLSSAALARLPDASQARLGPVSILVGESDQEVEAPTPPVARAVDRATVRLACSPKTLIVALDASTDRAAEALLTWLEEPRSLDQLAGITGELVAYTRRAANFDERYHSKRPKWSTSVMEEGYRCSLEQLDEGRRDNLFELSRNLDGRWEKLAVSCIRRWPDQKGQGSARLEGDVNDQFAHVAPIVGRLNYLVRQAKRSKAPALERAPWRPPG